MRTFHLIRDVDVSGVSGTGIVAQGVEFDDGTAAMRWMTATASFGLYDSMQNLEDIHGHNGVTRVVYD